MFRSNTEHTFGSGPILAGMRVARMNLALLHLHAAALRDSEKVTYGRFVKRVKS